MNDDDEMKTFDIEEVLIDVQRELKEIRRELDFIKEHIVKADDTIQMVSKEVMPTIDSLMKSPLVKMLGMKK